MDAPDNLTARQAAFCLEYIKDLNGTQAAIRAGYAPVGAGTEAGRLLKNAEVQARIAQLIDERNKAVEIDNEFVLRELLALASVDLAEAYDDEGNLKPIHEIPPHVRKAIAGIESLEEWAGKGKDRVFIGHTKKIKLWDRTKALELLGRHLALFNDKLQVSGTVNVAQRLIEGRKRVGG